MDSIALNRRFVVNHDFVGRREHDAAVPPFDNRLPEQLMSPHRLAHRRLQVGIDGGAIVEESLDIKLCLIVWFHIRKLA